MPWDKHTVSQDFIVSDCTLPLTAGIAGIAFYGIDDTILYLLYNSSVVRQTILWTGFAIRTVPVIEDNRPW